MLNLKTWHIFGMWFGVAFLLALYMYFDIHWGQ